MILSNRTAAIVATFTAVATTLAFTGCVEQTADSNEDYGETELTDDNGNPYTLIQNSDGTETAKYPDGKEVTFQRDEDGNMNFIAGSAGLLAGLAAGYFLFHGMNHGGGYYSGGNYYSNTRPNRISYTEQKNRLADINKKREDKKSGGSSSTSAAAMANTATKNSSASDGGGSSSSSSSNSKSNVTSNSSSNSSSVKSSSSTAKGGFGSAGARSGGSAVS